MKEPPCAPFHTFYVATVCNTRPCRTWSLVLSRYVRHVVKLVLKTSKAGRWHWKVVSHFTLTYSWLVTGNIISLHSRCINFGIYSRLVKWSRWLHCWWRRWFQWFTYTHSVHILMAIIPHSLIQKFLSTSSKLENFYHFLSLSYFFVASSFLFIRFKIFSHYSVTACAI